MIWAGDNDIIHVYEYIHSEGIWEKSVEEWVSSRGSKANLQQFATQVQKPCTRRLFETIDGLVQLAYVVR